MGRRARAGELDPTEVHSILICRINARMGNTMFLTPLIARLHELLPHAAIDVAVAYPKAADLLEPIPGVRRVITFPYKGVQIVWRYAAALRQVRRQRFDLAIDPAPDSTGDRIVMLLARARFRLGFESASQWAPLTHAAAMPREMLHQAAQPVFLVSRVLGAAWDPRAVRLELSLSPQEIAAGRAAVQRALSSRGLTPSPSRAFGFFAHATGHKTIGLDYWRAFWDAFISIEPEALPVEVLPAPDRAPTDPRCATLYFASPRSLAASMASMRMFVSGDTGPMHLASSTDVPTIALFHASDPALYGPLKRCDLALDPTRCTPVELATRCHEIWRRHTPAADASTAQGASR